MCVTGAVCFGVRDVCFNGQPFAVLRPADLLRDLGHRSANFRKVFVATGEGVATLRFSTKDRSERRTVQIGAVSNPSAWPSSGSVRLGGMCKRQGWESRNCCGRVFKWMWGSSFITCYQRRLRPPRKTILKHASTAHAHFLFLATLFASMDSLCCSEAGRLAQGPGTPISEFSQSFRGDRGGVSQHTDSPRKTVQIGAGSNPSAFGPPPPFSF